MPLTEFEISVRDLAEFVHRRGDIHISKGFQRADRALEGIKGHKRIQQSRGADYRPEVSVERIFTKQNVRLRVLGRLDGLIEGLTPLVEEIKTVEARWDRQADAVHWAQLRLYAGIMASEKGWPVVSLQLTYLELESNEVFLFREEASHAALVAFLEHSVEEWFSWLLPYADWLEARDASAEKLPFPFDPFRAGQRELAKSVYRAVQNRLNLFIEAPTGMGKTMATLYPAIKALPLLKGEKIFYATAKTPGRIAAEEALQKMREIGLQIRSLSITAKAKICFAPDSSGCDSATCPFLKGYYDRFKPAMRELLEFQRIDRETLCTIAQRHQVCPFELSLDVSEWIDVLIGDYNYVFDPSARLERVFQEGKARHVVLVDEAHNLVDRSREMYSASLSADDLDVTPLSAAGKGSRTAKKCLLAARGELIQSMQTEPSGLPPQKGYHQGAFTVTAGLEALVESLRKAATALETYLLEQTSREAALPWLNSYFAINSFVQVSEAKDDVYRTIIDPASRTVTLFCVDSSKRLAETLKALRTAVFFSATLSPLDYFVEVLGGSANSARGMYPSPFRPDQMSVQISPLNIAFQERERTMDSVAQTVQKHVRRNPGNHLIYCPSLAYLDQLHAKLSGMGLALFTQRTAMTEAERGSFLAKFTQERGSIGLAVLGGIFAEGIDLPGSQLIGVTIIGVGLPGLSIERDLVASYFDQKGKPGFDYAYRFPGMQRVLQAVGRLIRSENDEGAALLIDRRFLEARYQELFPRWWRILPDDESWDDNYL